MTIAVAMRFADVASHVRQIRFRRGTGIRGDAEQFMRPLIMIPILLLMAGCTTAAPKPYLDNISESMVKVAVNFAVFSGPPWKNAKEAADPVAVRHCAVYRKRAQLASSSKEAGALGRGTYYFLYRCLEETGR